MNITITVPDADAKATADVVAAAAGVDRGADDAATITAAVTAIIAAHKRNAEERAAMAPDPTKLAAFEAKQKADQEARDAKQAADAADQEARDAKQAAAAYAVAADATTKGGKVVNA